MVRCPKCNRTYENDSQKFCTRDGGRLTVVEAETPNFNPNATMVAQPSFDPNKTIVSQAENTVVTPQPQQPLFDPNKTAVSQPSINENIASSQPPIKQQASNEEVLETISVVPNVRPQASQQYADQPLPVVAIETEEKFDPTAASVPYQQKPLQPQTPMPARYEQASLTPEDANYPSGASPSTQSNAGYPSTGPTPRAVDTQFPLPSETQYSLEPPVQPSNEFQSGYDASYGETITYLPQNYGGQNTGYEDTNYQSDNAGPQSFSVHPIPTPMPVSSQAGVPSVESPKKKSNKLLFLGLGAVLFAFLLVIVGAAGFVLVMHPEWVGLGEKPANENINTPENINDNANTTNTNSNTNDSTNTTANTNAADNTNANTNTNTNANDNTSVTEPPPNSVQFVSSLSGLKGDLATYYAPFSLYYPQNWVKTPNPSGYFIEVIRRMPNKLTQEYFAVGYYKPKGTSENDSEIFEKLVQENSTAFSKRLTAYQKMSEGETNINGISGYEFKFSGQTSGPDKSSVELFGRMVFLPVDKEGKKNGGVTLVMYGTSLTPEVQSMDDFGIKGELPIILNTFKLSQ